MWWFQLLAVRTRISEASMNRSEIAREVALSLFTAEGALDAAIRDYARLTAATMEARARLGLSAAVGSEVVSRNAAVQSALAAARVESAALHAALAEVGAGIGVRMDDVGAGEKTETSRPLWPLGASSVEPLRAAG